MVGVKKTAKTAARKRKQLGSDDADPTVEKLVTVKKGNRSVKQMAYEPNMKQPSIMGRHLTLVEGARHARRPSKIARRAHHFNGTEIAWADQAAPPDGWTEDDSMPCEARAEDCGWRPGPAKRDVPKFKGMPPGPTDETLSSASHITKFLDSQLTQEFKVKVVGYTIEHCLAFRKAHPDVANKAIEKSMANCTKAFNVAVFDIWLACRMRAAQLKPEVPARMLWERDSSLFDVQVFNAITFNKYQWINRHVSFADVTQDDEDSDDDAEEGEDDLADGEVDEEGEDEEVEDVELANDGTPAAHGATHRKRRELTELACKAFGAAWRPHQFLGLDEAVRAHKHWGKTRIRFKAAVHSGSLVDSLNDCATKYCMWFEEQHWLKRQSKDDEDPNTIQSRLLRAAKVLCDDGKSTSSANYCVSLDRGYGHVQAQHALAEMGIFSNAVLPLTRIGIPRNYLKELSIDLSECPQVEGKACSHGPDASECRKYCYTALHKKSRSQVENDAAQADWELACWQDSQLIVSLSNFFSTQRAGEITRGTSGAAESYAVWAPESIWHYNMLGRSATDGCDQLRKKMSLAERRIVRAGVKGIAFVFDLAFTNAAIMWSYVHRASETRAALEQNFNKVGACLASCRYMCVLKR